VSKQSSELFRLLPKQAIDLLVTKGTGLIKQIGEDVIRGVIFDVMCGKNLRDSTEMLTRRRLALLNAAILIMFIRGQTKDKNFVLNTLSKASKTLQNRIPKEQRWVLQWLLGLTDKGFQNILRDRTEALEVYKTKYLEVCKDVVSMCAKEYGNLEGEIRLTNSDKAVINWNFIIGLLGTVGAQTLAIRGSEKATYGKLFERLVLGLASFDVRL
jgi:hypothetical protein